MSRLRAKQAAEAER